MQKGFTRNFKPLEVLTEEQVEAIWRGVFDVLEHTGLTVRHEEALKILEKGGCQVDYNNERVKFPPGIVTECLRKCPSSYRVKSRDPNMDVVVGGNKVYIYPGPGMQRLDLDTFEPRDATRQEFYDGVKVYDALDNLHVLHPNSPHFSFEGVHPLMASIESFAAKVRNSTKVLSMAYCFGGEFFNMEMAKMAGNGEAIGFYTIGCASPLTWPGRGDEDVITGALRAVEAGFPVKISGGSTWGASAPATIAGEIITNLCENIGPIVCIQLLKPGHPVSVQDFTFPMNMRNGAPFFGNIANALANAVFNQVWRKWGIPTWSMQSSIPNSKCIDFQAGYEKGMLSLAAAISGAAIVWIHGTVYGEHTAHPLQAILDDDIAGMIARFLEGVEVSDETTAIELIEQVGPIPGTYLGKEHTRKWWQKELYMPRAADFLTIPEWVKGGKKTCLDYAKARMEEILTTHKVSVPLTQHQEEEIERILAEARRHYKKKMEA